MPRTQSIEARAKQLLAQVQQLEQDGVTWVQAHNLLFGPVGAASQMFTTRQERAAFSQTSQHDEIHQRLAQFQQPKKHAGTAPSHPLTLSPTHSVNTNGD